VMVPSWWGILQVEEQEEAATMCRLRLGAPNPSRSPRAIVELLWRDEAVSLLESHGSAQGVRSRPRCEVWDRICETLELSQIRTAVRTSLIARTASTRHQL
jgi:hypothetical protein